MKFRDVVYGRLWRKKSAGKVNGGGRAGDGGRETIKTGHVKLLNGNDCLLCDQGPGGQGVSDGWLIRLDWIMENVHWLY